MDVDIRLYPGTFTPRSNLGNPSRHLHPGNARFFQLVLILPLAQSKVAEVSAWYVVLVVLARLAWHPPDFIIYCILTFHPEMSVSAGPLSPQLPKSAPRAHPTRPPSH
jgi:hypothetical protein